MKNFSFVSVALLSALAFTACTSSVPTPTETPETEALSYDRLPEGWLMKTTDEGVKIENTDKKVVWGGIRPDDYSEEAYQSENVATIQVNELDASVPVPPTENFGVTDMGSFIKVKTCDDVAYPECAIYGSSSYSYFLTMEDGTKFEFKVNSSDVPTEEIEAVISSLKN